MSGDSSSSLLRQFRTLFDSGTVAGLTDGQLLERFLKARDPGGEVAFEALVARHGPMVLGVCRRALADPNDAADAFQATFLVLVRKARSVRVDDSLGRWLYGVSRRVAGRARASANRRPLADSGEIDSLEADSPDPDRFELASLLDEELARLPESFRSALVLCDLEGLTHEEAARNLRCPVGTIKSRLSRGRERLRGRLARRGLAPSLVIVAPVVPALLAERTVRASMLSVGAGKATTGVVSASAVALAEGVVKSMNGMMWKLAGSAVLSLGVIATGAGVLAQSGKGESSSREAGKVRLADEPGKRASKDDPPGRRHLVEMLGDRIALDGKVATPEELKMSLSYTRAQGDPDPWVLMRVRSDTKYSDVIRVAEVIKAAGIADLRFENAEASIVGKGKETAKPDAPDMTLGQQLEVMRKLTDLPAVAGVPDETSRSLERLRDEVAYSRLVFEKLSRGSSDPQDPSIVRARQRFKDLLADMAQIGKSSSKIPDNPAKTTVPAGRPRWSGRVQGGEPPREFSKVSMPDYVVEPPDIITVEVLEALPGRPITGERLVRPDGKISLGFYGEVYVAGLTTTEIKAKVALHLREYLGDDNLGLTRPEIVAGKVERVKVAPDRTSKVFVDVTAYNSKVYYVQGDVGSPGRLPITGNETVLDAINFAGGLVPTASKVGIRLIRPSPLGASQNQTLPVNLDAINQGDGATNYQLLPGDRLMVYREPKVAQDEAKVSNPEKAAPSDVEARLQAVEQKLGEVLKALERLSKP